MSDMTHLDGVSWNEAPIPKKRHKCFVQTEGWLGLTKIQRCACGAIKMPRIGDRPQDGWAERNARRT